MCGVLALAPLDLVDLLLDLERLEVVEFRLMRLELRVELVLASLFLFASKEAGPIKEMWEREIAKRKEDVLIRSCRAGRGYGVYVPARCARRGRRGRLYLPWRGSFQYCRTRRWR